MTKKCFGCGTRLQSEDKSALGYVYDLNRELCERCFRINNYGEYKEVAKSNEEYIKILKQVSKTKDLVLLVVDSFNLDKLDIINDYLTNPMILVLTKRDVLPKSLNDEKILNYLNSDKLNIVNKIIISSYKNYNFDELLASIRRNQRTENVYVVGFTNSGKSTMINKLMHNYSTNKSQITTSILPSTTLDTIEIKLDEKLKLIDTPGLLIEGDITNYVDAKMLKKIIPNKEIKPLSYQIKGKQTIIVEDLLKIEVDNNNVILYFSNQLKIERYYKEKVLNLEKHELKLNGNEDVVVKGLGFFKVLKQGNIAIYTLPGVSVYKRKAII